mmetsp:Transcript_175313/g.562315  ORF Transcript_175313/g.562315 Transcript_175313/m.562315 type:complete len:210 (+) Transcript_175313:172-801(+)
MSLPPLGCGGLRPTQSLQSDGSGRDSYVVMVDDHRKGQQQGHANWFSNLRKPPQAMSQHCKPLERWFHGGSKRPGHWSPPAPLPSVKAAAYETGPSAATGRSLGRLQSHSVSSLRCRVPATSGSGGHSARHAEVDEAASAGELRQALGRSASLPAAPTRVAWAPSPAEGTPAEAALGRMLLRATSSFRLRDRRSHTERAFAETGRGKLR